MQRLAIAWLAASLGAAGCASTRPAPERAEAAPTEVNKQVARRFFAEILNEGRFEVAGELYAPDFRNGKYTQQDDIEAARGWRQAVPDLRFDLELVVAEGDYVSVFWKAGGTNTGTGNGLPATGRKFQARGVTIWKLVDGRLKQEWTVMNEASVRRQLGLGCEPALF